MTILTFPSLSVFQPSGRSIHLYLSIHMCALSMSMAVLTFLSLKFVLSTFPSLIFYFNLPGCSFLSIPKVCLCHLSPFHPQRFTFHLHLKLSSNEVFPFHLPDLPVLSRKLFFPPNCFTFPFLRIFFLLSFQCGLYYISNPGLCLFIWQSLRRTFLSPS